MIAFVRDCINYSNTPAEAIQTWMSAGNSYPHSSVAGNSHSFQILQMTGKSFLYTVSYSGTNFVTIRQPSQVFRHKTVNWNLCISTAFYMQNSWISNNFFEIKYEFSLFHISEPSLGFKVRGYPITERSNNISSHSSLESQFQILCSNPNWWILKTFQVDLNHLWFFGFPLEHKLSNV